MEMQFMADIYLPCEDCNGKRFKQQVLDITYKEKNVSEILDMTIDEAVDFFKDEQKILNKLNPLVDVGLGYVHLGQSSNTLSGGEAQRVAFCRAMANKPTLLLADEPTGNLDPKTSDQVFGVLMEIVRETGLSALIATHNLELADRMDRVLRLEAGRLSS